jgi:hypothetical protein
MEVRFWRDMAIALAALAVGAWSAVTAYKTWFDERNARLVEIGVNILRADPQKETNIEAARAWALDLIDANSGGVRFSREARTELLKRPLNFAPDFIPDNSDYSEPIKPPRRSRN